MVRDLEIDPSGRALDCDVIVIGGGVNGVGVARDASLRGLTVALFERNDIAFGASGNSSGMIHGGPRYLTYDPAVTHSSCLDSGHIQRIAPHLLFRIPFLMPIFSSGALKSKIALTGYDAFFDLYDAYQPLKAGKNHVRLSADEINQLEPGLVGGAVGRPDLRRMGHRRRAPVHRQRGGRPRARRRNSRALHRDRDFAPRRRPRVRRALPRSPVRRDRPSARRGSWSTPPARGHRSRPRSGGLAPNAARIRPGKGIHVFLDRRLTNYAIIAHAIDGRQVFLLPWQNMSVLGTTDDDYYGDLDHVVATSDEVNYLFQAVERVFPAVRSARAIGTWGGVRPTLYEWGPNEDELSREHQVVDHQQHGADGLYSMIGGKLASYRLVRRGNDGRDREAAGQ